MARQLTEAQKKELAILKANQEMLERTKRECLEIGEREKAELIQTAQKENLLKGQMKGYDNSDIVNAEYKEPMKPKKSIHGEDKKNTTKVMDFKEPNIEVKPATSQNVIEIKKDVMEPQNTKVNWDSIGSVPTDIAYDMIELPSNGECYPSKKNKITIGYLTAEDENVITSPQLYKDGMVMDVLLRRKVLDKDIDIDSLCKGDRDAIILWLRATSYGTDFPITVQDPKSGERFDTTIDLSTIKYKDFKLKGDEEGLFLFETPRTKDKIKFKFFTRNDEKEMEKLDKMNNLKQAKYLITRQVEELSQELSRADYLTDSSRRELSSSINTISRWADAIEVDDKYPVSQSVTTGMYYAIVEVNGNRDRNFIWDYIRRMPAYDSLMFRRYLNENEPSLDFKITVERPQSLGGGSFETFLEIDYTLFLNIAKL